MHIAINCRSYLNKNFTGIGRYASGLVNSLGQVDQGNQYLLYCPKKPFNLKQVYPKPPASNFQLIKDPWKKGLQASLENVDVYHTPCPDIFDVQGCKIIVTVHDLVYKAFPEGHTKQTLRLTDEQFNFFLPRADHLICCSEHTKKDLMHFHNVDSDKVSVIHHWVDPNAFYVLNEKERRKAGAYVEQTIKNKHYILYVGTIEPRKNLKNLLKAFAQLKHSIGYEGALVIVGMKGWLKDDLREMAVELKIDQSVVFPGFIQNKELRWLYNCCEAFVFPSFYEGFGYPILEAFACGAPVITSRASSCPEVAGEAALLVDPHSIEDIYQNILVAIQKEDLREDLIRRGLERVQLFTAKRSAMETLAVYNRVGSR